MKRWHFLGLTIVIARSAAGQTPAQPEPPAVSSMEEVHKDELRIGLSSLVAMRSSVLGVDASTPTTASISGVELFAKTQGIGLYARSLSGTFATGSAEIAGAFVLQEARVVIGEPVMSVEAGVIRRTTSGADTPHEQTFWRGGLRSMWDIGSSGVQVTLNAGVRIGHAPDGTSSSTKVLGADGEAIVIYQAPRGLPLYALLGWHYERFDDAWSAEARTGAMLARTEELTGPLLGIGFRLATAPFLR